MGFSSTTTMSISPTSDGGFLAVGSSQSFDTDPEENTWVLRFDSNADVVWQSVLPETFTGRKVFEDTDGTILVAGDAHIPGQPSIYNGSTITRLNANGMVLSSTARGAFWYNGAQDLILTTDSGYAVLAQEGGRGTSAIYKYDSAGAAEFRWRYVAPTFTCARIVNWQSLTPEALVQTSDGGYVLVGATKLTERWCDGKNFATDLSVIRLDSQGSVLWEKTFGGGERDIGDHGESIIQTTDGGFLVAGSTESFGAGSKDAWLLKLDSLGAVEWQKAYGGLGNDVAETVIAAAGGGYVIAGHTASFGNGDDDFWVFKIDGMGDIEWERAFGGGLADRAYSVLENFDGFLVFGSTASFGAGNEDFWLLQLDSDGELGTDCDISPDTTATITITTAIEDSRGYFAQGTGFAETPLPTIGVGTLATEQTQCPAFCGDDIVQIGERCDTFDLFSLAPHCASTLAMRSCALDCQSCIAKCGNSVLESPGEQCDFGDILNGDGCSSTCQFEDNDGDGVIDFDEFKFGTNHLDPTSFPVTVKVDTYLLQSVFINPAVARYIKGKPVTISDRRRMSARLVNVTDQNGSPVVLRDATGTIRSPAYSGSVLVVEKTATRTGLEFDAETDLLHGQNLMTVSKSGALDLVPAQKYPAPAYVIEMEFGASVRVIKPNP